MAAPGIPTNFIVQQGNSQVLLTWDLMAGATSYPVYRSTDGVTFTLLASPATNLYLDLAVTNGTLYYYKIQSSNGTPSPFTSIQQIIPSGQGDMSLAAIRLQAQQRADRANSQFVGTAEWNTYINQAAFELYDLLVTLYEDFYLAPQAIFQANGAAFYPMPDGQTTFMNLDGSTFVAPPFYKLAGVDCGLALNNNAWVTLHKFNFIQRNRYVFPNITSTFLGVYNLRYRLVGNNLEFIPTPSSGQFIRIWYVPRMVQLLEDTDILDGVSGWSEYVIVRAAKYALDKEESDTTKLDAQIAFLKARIEESAMNRDQGQPDTISDTRSWENRHGNYGGLGDDGSYGGF